MDTASPHPIASRTYNICNKGNHLPPYVMGAFYSTWVTNTEALHMALYYNVREGKILWINGKRHSQSEIVLEYNIDCRTISQSQTPTLHGSQNLLGSIETWPSEIIKLHFIGTMNAEMFFA